jgi:hypothetical protein
MVFWECRPKWQLDLYLNSKRKYKRRRNAVSRYLYSIWTFPSWTSELGQLVDGLAMTTDFR